MALRGTVRFHPLRWIMPDLRGELSQIINISRWPVGSSSSDCALPSNRTLLNRSFSFQGELLRKLSLCFCCTSMFDSLEVKSSIQPDRGEAGFRALACNYCCLVTA